MPTLKDIAAVCNVHISTVSRALNNYKDIPEDTRRRICETARLMGYGAAAVPADKIRTSRIGVLLPEGSGAAFYTILYEIWKYLLTRGYDLVLLHPLRAEGGIADAPGYLAKARVMGLEGVVVLMHIDEVMLYQTDRHIAVRDLLVSEIPVVVVDSYVGFCRCILPGYEEGMRALVGYICQKGHKRIALVQGNRDTGSEGGGHWREWKEMFSEAVNGNRSRVPENLVKCVKAEDADASFFATLELLQEWKWFPPTCILYTDAQLLQGGMEAVSRCGLRIPEDISVAAIRLAAPQEDARRRVTSWCFDPAAIAEEAVKKLLSGSKPTDSPGNRVGIVSGTLSVGNTVSTIP